MDSYTVTMSWGETWKMEANWAEPSSQIIADGDPTPFQVGDARHNPERAADLIAEWWSTQGDYLGDDGSVASVK